MASMVVEGTSFWMRLISSGSISWIKSKSIGVLDRELSLESKSSTEEEDEEEEEATITKDRHLRETAEVEVVNLRREKVEERRSGCCDGGGGEGRREKEAEEEAKAAIFTNSTPTSTSNSLSLALSLSYRV